MTSEDAIRLAKGAIQLSTEDGRLTSFADNEKTIIDNVDFIYWLVVLAQREEREACAKVCYELPWKDMTQIPSNLAFAAAIRARGEA